MSGDMIGISDFTHFLSYNPKDEYISVDAPIKGFVDHCSCCTTVIKIKNLIKQLESHQVRLKNITKAKTALKSICDNAASPRESLVAALLSGPRCRGMFAKTGMKLNYEYKFSYDAEQIAGQSKAFIDICFPKEKVAIEYDSRMFHSDTEKSQHDKMRTDALIYDGWNVISIVPNQINNPIAFYNIALKVLSLCKKTTYIKTKHFSSLYGDTFRKLKSATIY